jgi:hypothetical protein
MQTARENLQLAAGRDIGRGNKGKNPLCSDKVGSLKKSEEL